MVKYITYIAIIVMFFGTAIGFGLTATFVIKLKARFPEQYIQFFDLSKLAHSGLRPNFIFQIYGASSKVTYFFKRKYRITNDEKLIMLGDILRIYIFIHLILSVLCFILVMLYIYK